MNELTMWIARDKNKALYLYSKMPAKDKYCYFNPINKLENLALPPQMFPDVTFENGPKRVKITVED